MLGFDFGKARRIMIGLVNVVIHVRDVPRWAWLLMIAAMYPSSAATLLAFVSGQAQIEDGILLITVFLTIFVVWRVLSLTPILSKASWDENDWIRENVPTRHLVRYLCIFTASAWIGMRLTDPVFDIFVDFDMSKLSVSDRQNVLAIGRELVRAESGDLVIQRNGLVEVILMNSDAIPNMWTQCKGNRDHFYNFHQDGRPKSPSYLRTMLGIQKIVPRDDAEYREYASKCWSYNQLRRNWLRSRGIPEQCIDQPPGTVFQCEDSSTGYCRCL